MMIVQFAMEFVSVTLKTKVIFAVLVNPVGLMDVTLAL